MLNYTKTFANRLQKNVKIMKNLQKPAENSVKKPKSIQNRLKLDQTKSKNIRHAQSADTAILNFHQVNYLTVTHNQSDQRLDNFLLARLKGLPRSHLYKLIRDDEIRINGKRCKPHQRLQAKDVVRIAPIRLNVKQQPMIGEDFAKGLMRRVIFEDDRLLVLNKPHGMAVHGGSGESFGVIEAMRVVTNKNYLELIHRIDKETSGILLIAKKRSALKQIQDNFREKTIQKSYLCLVYGSVKKDSDWIDKPLLRYTLQNGERRVKVHHEGKPSQTYFQVLARFMLENTPVSLVLAHPKTGRTHQIRVHMASIGHALLGDDKYQTKPNPSQIKRLCLHAWQLALPDDNREMKFLAPLPADMADLLPDFVVNQLQKSQLLND